MKTLNPVVGSTIAVRAYATPIDDSAIRPSADRRDALGSSEWSLILDTETSDDPGQNLRFGTYQVRRKGELQDAGIFYNPQTISESGVKLIEDYGLENHLTVVTVERFIEDVFFYYAYDLGALCIGFNLPFDLSRLALSHSPARGRMRGGFSFKLSENKERPRVRVKHLNHFTSLIDFSAPAEEYTPRSERNRGDRVPPNRGYFVDCHTLAGALYSRSFTLKSLAEYLKTEHQKLETDEYGGPITSRFLEYAVNDVRVTWDCFAKMKARYDQYGLTKTPINKIFSEASIGKGLLREIGVRPWREVQPDFPPEIIGTIMSAYYGGRSEVHIRRQVARVRYCDFLSMYPTVCTLMGLWPYVVAEGIQRYDATSQVKNTLETITLEDLQNPETWKNLTAIVQIEPDEDILPVRSKYDDRQFTIGLNKLEAGKLWYTLADCIASKLLTGRSPRVIQAIGFKPKEPQQGLNPIEILGNPNYSIDPYKDDLYQNIINMKTEVKSKLKTSQTNDLEFEYEALKKCANATSYGIFIELNVVEKAKPTKVRCYGVNGKPFVTKDRNRNVEEPGKYFHPLVGVLITGAARLMLSIAESLTEQAGLTWAFCDTDSIAIAKPDGLLDSKFRNRAGQITNWFTPLNPYKKKGALLEIEDENYSLDKSKKLGDLYCFAVSAKRYALFNTDETDRPVPRKLSAHGLGHLLPPDCNKKPRNIPEPVVPLEKLGVELWEYYFWYRIIESAIAGSSDQVKIRDLPDFNFSSVSKYAATTPTLLNWFKTYNDGKAYKDQVKPFNFMLAFQAQLFSKSKPIAPYDKNRKKAVTRCFDRETGLPVTPENLKTYVGALCQYHLHPESKFENGDYSDSGVTKRRTVIATEVVYIGKEANRLDEQSHLPFDETAQIIYGMSPQDFTRSAKSIIQEANQFKRGALALASGLSKRQVLYLLGGGATPTKKSITKLATGIKILREL